MSLFRAAFLPAFALVFLVFNVMAQKPRGKQADPNGAKNKWIDSVYNALTPEERIGQMFIVQAYSGGKNYNEEQVAKLISAHQVGGIIFSQGGPVRQADMTNRLQHLAQTPLFISMDAEWGLGMRLDSVKPLPRQMMIGATRDTAIAYRIGATIAAQCKRLSVNIDFAPDVDVNNNALNPVINSRSFGEDKTWVAKLGLAFMHALQYNGVIACAKHFPGHGDTNVDSHNDLPVIPRSLAQLDSLELYPFKQLIAGGVKSIMIAHLDIPALDTASHVSATLSKNAVNQLLRNKLGFNGIIITDALNMQAVTKYFPNGEAELRAFMAGNDILLMSQDVPVAITRIKNAIDSNLVPANQLEQSVKRILAAKYDAGLTTWKDINTKNLTNDLNQNVDALRNQVAKAAVTLVKDDNQVMRRSMRICVLVM